MFQILSLTTETSEVFRPEPNPILAPTDCCELTDDTDIPGERHEGLFVLLSLLMPDADSCLARLGSFMTWDESEIFDALEDSPLRAQLSDVGCATE